MVSLKEWFSKKSIFNNRKNEISELQLLSQLFSLITLTNNQQKENSAS